MEPRMADVRALGAERSAVIPVDEQPPAAAAALAAVDDPVVLFVASAPDAWHVAWVNEAYERAAGWAITEVVGTPASEVLGPVVLPQVFRRPCAIPTSNGTPLHCDLQAGPVPGEPGEPAWCWVVLHRRHEGLARRERRFRALVDGSSDIVLLIDAAGVLRYSSPAVERVLGRSLEGHLIEDAGVLQLGPPR